MSLALDLLEQAGSLARLDAGRPKQANLRRALSSAYYALFQLLVSESARRLSPGQPSGLLARVSRCYAHDEMKQVCRSITEGTLPTVMNELVPSGFSDDLQRVARTFVRLQEVRHKADYDTSAQFSRASVQDMLDQAQEAFAAYCRVRETEETTVFLTALLLAKRWSR